MLTISERKQLHDRLKLGSPSILGRVKATRPRTDGGGSVPPRVHSSRPQSTGAATSSERYHGDRSMQALVAIGFYLIVIGAAFAVWWVWR